MPVIDMTHEKAEAELLELIRRQDAKNLTVTVMANGDEWTIVAKDLASPGRAIGRGSCFAEAWFSQKPDWDDDTSSTLRKV